MTRRAPSSSTPKLPAKRPNEGDIGSRVLFEKIALDEEGHMSWLDLQLSLIARMGEPAYIAKHMSVPGEGGEKD